MHKNTEDLPETRHLVGLGDRRGFGKSLRN